MLRAISPRKVEFVRASALNFMFRVGGGAAPVKSIKPRAENRTT